MSFNASKIPFNHHLPAESVALLSWPSYIAFYSLDGEFLLRLAAFPLGEMGVWFWFAAFATASFIVDYAKSFSLMLDLDIFSRSATLLPQPSWCEHFFAKLPRFGLLISPQLFSQIRFFPAFWLLTTQLWSQDTLTFVHHSVLQRRAQCNESWHHKTQIRLDR